MHIVEDHPADLYHALVEQERTLFFVPKSEVEVDYTAPLWPYPREESEAIRDLTTEHNEAELNSRLIYINRQARTVIEEQGYNALFLAMGFLRWKDEEGMARTSPLALVPVDLERTSGNKFKLKWDRGEIFANATLAAKMREFKMTVPEREHWDSTNDFISFLDDILEQIRDWDEWEIVLDVHMAFFNFTKYIMYRDLDPATWPRAKSPADHPIFRAILDPNIVHDPVTAALDLSPSKDQFLIMDADSSQVEAIEAVKAGHNLVIQGPPGTGKSQTITNMIAELLGLGKTVLFVAEKMAALEVVKSRLDSVDLGHLCLELHSRKANKRSLLKEIQEALALAPAISGGMANELKELREMRHQLDHYPELLGKSMGSLGLTVYELYDRWFGSLHHFNKTDRQQVTVNIPEAEALSREKDLEAENKLKELGALLPKLGPVTRHPWRGTNPGTLHPSDLEGLERYLTDAARQLDELQETLTRAVEASGIRTAGKIRDLFDTGEVLELLSRMPELEDGNVLAGSWEEDSDSIDDLFSTLTEVRELSESMKETFTQTALEGEVREQMDELRGRAAKGGLGRMKDARFKELRTWGQSLYRRPPKKVEGVVEGFDELERFHNLKDMVLKQEELGTTWFGTLWKGLDTDVDRCLKRKEWLAGYHAAKKSGTISSKTTRRLADIDNLTEVRAAQLDYAAVLEEFSGSLDLIVKLVGLEKEEILDEEVEPFTTRVAGWSRAMERISEWTRYTVVRNSLVDTAAGPLIEEIEKGNLGEDDLLITFQGSVAEALLRRTFDLNPELGQFLGDLHEDLIRRYQEMDQRILNGNRQRIINVVDHRRPHFGGQASPTSEIGILKAEFERKRGHMSIRRLMSRCGTVVQRIKPCFMMSPLSVAQFLEISHNEFDVVIFDEASQVKPEDAVGAVIRGNQLVVVGDSNQLPPTSFFDVLMDSDGDVYEDHDEDVVPLAEMESVLTLCRVTFPQVTLLWHYRSKHESLIAASNQEFYENQLVVFPSPFKRGDTMGLEFRYTPDGVYSRGKKRKNEIEAAAVADEVIRFHREPPELSVGVACFSLSQQAAILDEVDKRVAEDRQLEALLDDSKPDPFFVKNLETIQGDERDVILISVGYGRDEAGELGMNFGPLNKEGGERRLNVLFTRARQKCVVFANFRPVELPSEIESSGVRSLRAYLSYAEEGNLASATIPPTTSLEAHVIHFLSAHGYEVEEEIGAGDFRVNLAVLDPDKAGHYLLGLMFDDQRYHLLDRSRDRERLRPQVLHRMGWDMHRVWVTDWYLRPKQAQKDLLAALNTARKGERVGKTAVAPAAEPIEREAKSLSAELEITRPYSRVAISASDLPEDVKANPDRVEEIILSMVDEEGPVHFEDLMDQLKVLWGLDRWQKTTKGPVTNVIQGMTKKGTIRQKGEFFWPADRNRAGVRKRARPSLKRIPPEEVVEAALFILKYQYSTERDDLARSVAKALGFRQVTDTVAAEIQSMFDELVEQHVVEARGVSRVAIPVAPQDQTIDELMAHVDIEED